MNRWPLLLVPTGLLRRLLAVAATWLAASLVVAAQGQLYRYSPDFGLSRRNFCDTIAIEVDDGQIIIPVQMGGRTVRLLLDTGSSQGMVYQGASIEGLQELGSIVSRDANNRTDTVSVVGLPPFRLGSLTVTGYVASLMPRSAVGRRFDAVVGFDLFNRGLCGKIDTRHRRLILTDRRKFFRDEVAASGHSVKYRLKWFVPYLYVSPFVRHTDEALFDTGFPRLYTMNRESLAHHQADDLARLSKSLGADIDRQIEGRAEGQVSIGGFGTEQKAEVTFLHLDRLGWGDFSFTDVRAITTEGASKVGTALLDYGAVVIDPFRKQIAFLPDSAGTSVRVGNKPLSVAFVPWRGQAAVGLVFEGGEPYRAGMRQGDVILQIDDQPILTFADFLRYRFIKGQAHRFRLRSADGREKIVRYVMTE